MATFAKQQAAQSSSAYFSARDTDKHRPAKTGQTSSQSQGASVHSTVKLSTAASENNLRRANHAQSSSAVRAWRFPSSRRFLWDRTATGPCLQLHPQAFLPTVILRQQAFTALQDSPAAAQEVHLPASWQVARSNAVSLAIGAGASEVQHTTFSLAVRQGSKELHECCFGDAALDLAQQLSTSVETGINVRAAVSINQVYAVACHSSAAQLHCQVALPGASVLLTPLYAKKICQVPQSQSLQANLQQSAAKMPQNGLLSMDQARSLLPLLADDPNAYNVPLVGVWVSGIANPKHPLVWLACLKFFATRQLQDKVMQGNQAFLLLLYSSGSHPTCYEARVEASEQTMPVWSLRCAAARPSRGDATCSLVPMRHADNSIKIAQGNAAAQAVGGSRPSSSHSWRSQPPVEDAAQGTEPRRQTLPQPHTSPSFLPPWASRQPNTFPQSASSIHPSYSSTLPEGHDQGLAPHAASDSYGSQSTSTSLAHMPDKDMGVKSVSDATSRQSAQMPLQSSWQPHSSPSQAQLSLHSSFQQQNSPSRQSGQPSASVNITITGACLCQSPGKQDMRKATPDVPQLTAQQSTSNDHLNTEASLAHLHHPRADAFTDAVLRAPSASHDVTRQLPSTEAIGSSLCIGQGSSTAAQEQQQLVGVSTCIDTAALQKEVTELRQQLQSLMLQMAANAAAPPGRPSRTAETNTSMLWAPSAPLLPHQPSDLPPAGTKADSEQAQQMHEQIRMCPTDSSQAEPGGMQLHPRLQQDQQPNSERDQLSPQHAQRATQQEGQQAEQPVAAVPASAAAAGLASAVASSVSGQIRPKHAASVDRQEPDNYQQAKQASHHDAHQPWASCWTQPALPSLALPGTQRASSTAAAGQQGQQQRRVTASDVPNARMLQQQAARKTSGLQAARSLSWGQSAEDQARSKLRSSDFRGSAAGSALMQQLEPATPPASLLRDEATYDGADSQAGTSAWEGSPKVGAQWDVQQEQIHVRHLAVSSHLSLGASEVNNQDPCVLKSDAPPSGSSSIQISSRDYMGNPTAEPSDLQGPILLASASPQRQLQPRAVKCHAAAAASSIANSPVLMSGTGEGMLTVVRTQFVPLADSLSDSDSDSEDIRLERKYGIIRHSRRTSSLISSNRESTSSFLPDMSLDSRLYLRMHEVWQHGAANVAASENMQLG